MNMPRHTRRPTRLPRALAPALLALPLAAQGMVSLSEEELSTVDAQDGLSWTLSNSSNVTASALRLESDTGATLGRYQADTVRLSPTGVGGDPTSAIFSATLDVGATASTVTLPGFALLTSLNRIRLGGTGTDGFYSRMTAEPTRSFGQWSLVSDLNFGIVGVPLVSPQPGGGGTSAGDVTLNLSNGTLFYRQFGYPNANIALDDFNFFWQSPGTISIDDEGIRIAAPTATLRVDFNGLYKYNADQNMTTVTTNDRPIVRFAWGGTLYDGLLRLRSGGVWNTAVDSGTNATWASLPSSGQTEGLRVGMRWNYRDALNNQDFLWSLGHIEGEQEFAEFGDWRNIEQATGAVAGRYGFDFPLIVIDAVDVGSATNAGGSLCWGNTMTGAACTAGAGWTTSPLAPAPFPPTLLTLRAGTVEGFTASVNRTGGATSMHLIRNANLLATSNQIRLRRNYASPTTEGNYNWGLIYTIANINQNVYIYPGGNESDSAGGSRNHGAIVDLLMTSQTFGTWESNYLTTSGGVCNAGTGAGCVNTTRWTNGTHFALVDTDAQMGIGLFGSSLLIAVDDLRIWLKNTTNGQAYPYNWEGGIDLFSPRTRIHQNTLFGGARFPRGHDLVRGAYIDMNLEGLWNFRLSPSHYLASDDETNDYLAWSAALRLRCGTVTPFGCTDNAFTDAAGSTIASGRGSYVSISEPGYVGVDLKIGDISGDIAWTEGILQLRSSTDTNADIAPGTPDKNVGIPDLVLASKLLIGASAADRMTDAVTGSSLGNGGAAGRTVTVNTSFGGNQIWSLAAPAGSFYSAFTLMPQQ